MPPRPLPALVTAPAAPRRSFVLAALLAVVAALSVDVQALLERVWPAPAAAALPPQGDTERAIDAAWQLGSKAHAPTARTRRLVLQGLDVQPLPANAQPGANDSAANEGADAPGSALRLAAVVSGGVRPRYRWDFGDGSPPTDWSILYAVRHRFNQPGTYTVQLTVVDDRGHHLDHRQQVTVPEAAR